MRRALLGILATALLLAPAAAAKGPHAVLRTSGERIEAGRAWPVRIELFEHPAALAPVLLATRGEQRVQTHPRLVRRGPQRTVYRATLVLPTEGEWQLKLYDGRTGFRFMPATVGGARPFRTDIAFPGMMGRPTALPPERFVLDAPATDATEATATDGPPAWVALPLAGLALAGAGVVGRRRRQR